MSRLPDGTPDRDVRLDIPMVKITIRFGLTMDAEQNFVFVSSKVMCLFLVYRLDSASSGFKTTCRKHDNLATKQLKKI